MVCSLEESARNENLQVKNHLNLEDRAAIRLVEATAGPEDLISPDEKDIVNEWKAATNPEELDVLPVPKSISSANRTVVRVVIVLVEAKNFKKNSGFRNVRFKIIKVPGPRRRRRYAYRNDVGINRRAIVGGGGGDS